MQAVPENQATKQVRREHANQDKNILQAHLHQVPQQAKGDLETIA